MIWRYLPYTLRLHAPLLVTGVTNDPNGVRTLPFIPGSAIRGAAARAVGDPDADPDRVEPFRRLILGEKVRFLNAYPRAADRRSLPMPVSFRADQAEPGLHHGPLKILDLAAFHGDDWPEAALAAVPAPFFALGAQPLRVAPERGSRFHHQRDRARGRAWTDPETGQPHGSVFAFEFIESGQEFDGLIQLCADTPEECDALIQEIRAAIREPLLLGRSRRGGYGGAATIQWRAPTGREVEAEGVLASDLRAGTEFRLLLTSAYIGRDPITGQLDPSQLTGEVVEALAGRVQVLRCRWNFDLVGGFNRKWRLELPQALACSAGSVLVLKSTATIPLGDLLAVEHMGLGERRVDGFGRGVFLEAPSRVPGVLRAPVRPREGQPPGAAPELVRFAQARIMETVVERAIQEEAARVARRARGRVPTPALLGRLRNAMRTDPATALATMRAWLGGMLRSPAMDQLERCRVDQMSLADWLRGVADEDDGTKLAELLRFDTLAQRFHVDAETSARAQLTERAAAIRARLMDAALAALARRQRKEAGR